MVGIVNGKFISFDVADQIWFFSSMVAGQIVLKPEIDICKTIIFIFMLLPHIEGCIPVLYKKMCPHVII